jgi:HK97 family phage prohead protease
MQRFMVGGAEPLGANEIGVVAASSDLARDGHVLEVRGLNIENYRKNPIVLYQHLPEEPIGACSALSIVGDKLMARITLSDATPRAQQALALSKAGILKGISVGFDVIDAEPLNPARGASGGMRVTSSELLEISLVSIPADVNGAVVARSYAHRPGTATALRALAPLSAAAISRALAQIEQRSRERAEPFVPIYMRSPQEQWYAYHGRHTMDAYVAGEASKQEAYERRLAELAALKRRL